MNKMETIDELLNKFKLASRELFNHYFHKIEPYDNDGWEWEERFSIVQATLFEELVTVPMNLSKLRYGEVQPEISVKLNSEGIVPIMINREIDSGYWDFSVKEIDNVAKLAFISFFDWDQLGYRDNRYVRVIIQGWEHRPEAVGKHAIIESQYVKFSLY